MKSKTIDTQELYAAKETYYEQINMQESASRKRENVYARTAFANAFRPVAGPSIIGKVLGKDHSSVVHYTKMHDELIKYDDYKKLYEKALSHRKGVIEQDSLPFMSPDDLLAQIKVLRSQKAVLENEIKKLYIYKDQINEIKKML